MLDFEESGKSSARKRTYQSIPCLDVPIPKASYESWPTAESEKCESKAENCSTNQMTILMNMLSSG